jgi:bifunctional DNase/RNase
VDPVSPDAGDAPPSDAVVDATGESAPTAPEDDAPAAASPETPTMSPNCATVIGPEPVTDFRTVVVSTVTVDLPAPHATVVLREEETPRRHLSFAIGMPDAVALSHALRRIATPRPLTAELMTEVLEGAEVDLVAVRLVGRRGSVYFAELDVRSRAGRRVHPCRPSDGLTLALLQQVPVPVLVDKRLFESTGDVEAR